MATTIYRPAVLGTGQVLWNHVIWKGTTIVLPLELNVEDHIEIQFYSQSGDYLFSLSTLPDKAKKLNFSFTVDEKGGLEKFSFETVRNNDFIFYNLIECRIYVNGNHWYTGELIYEPKKDDKSPTLTYEGKGFLRYLKNTKFTQTYTSQTLEYIIKDIIQNYAITDTPLEYNSALVSVPSLTITNIEFNKITVYKAFEELLKMANYDFTVEQYQFGINKLKEIYFNLIDDDLQDGLFEGFHYQDPEVENDIDSIVNIVNVYRTQSSSQTVEFVTSVSDSISQARWGKTTYNLYIPFYIDNTTAQRMAEGILEKYKDELTSVKIENLKTGDTPFEIGKYSINNERRNYDTLINEFEDLSEWDTTNIVNTTITVDDFRVFSGRKSFKILNTTGSTGEYLEYTLPMEINEVKEIRIMKWQDTSTQVLKLIVYDSTGSNLSFTLDTSITEDYYEQVFDVSTLLNISKIRIELLSDTASIIYLDRILGIFNGYFHRELNLKKITYKLTGNKNLLAEAEFGEKIDSIVEDLKDMEEEQENIKEIFNK